MTTAAHALDETSVAEAMHAGVVTCPPKTPMRAVAGMMFRFGIHAVVVFTEAGDPPEAAGVWGVVADTDLIGAVAAGDVDDRTAGGAARTPPVTIQPHEPLRRAAQLMKEHHVTHLLVVATGSERPIGVLSALDLARELS